MRRTTVLGFDERVERVLAYAFLWVSGLLLFMVEVRPTEGSRIVRWNAVQSMITFGTLTLLIVGVNVLRGMLSWVPVLGLLTDFDLSLLINVLWWTMGILWVWLMAMAWMHPRYRLPLVGEWMRYFV